MISFRTIFIGVDFQMPKLGGLELGDIEGEINTFPGEEFYAFSLELNFFELFKTAANLKLVRREDTGELIPDDLYFFLQAKPGIPLIPPAPVLMLNGGGGGFQNLAKTINGDYYAIPPFTVQITAAGSYVGVLDGNARLNGTFQIPKKIKIVASEWDAPVIGGLKLAGADIDLTTGVETVIPIRGVTVAEGIAKSFENINMYIGVCCTATVLGSDARCWMLLPDVIEPEKGQNWDFDCALFSSLDEWDWKEVLNNRSSRAMLSYAAAPGALDDPDDSDPNPGLFALDPSPASITLSGLKDEESGYLQLVFDKEVTEETLRSDLTVKKGGTEIPLTCPVWDAKNEYWTNTASVNVSSDLVTNTEDGEEYRYVLVYVGKGGTANGTYTAEVMENSRASVAMAGKGVNVQPLDRLGEVDFTSDPITGSVEYPVEGKQYTPRTYLSSTKGGAEYMVSERVLDNPASFEVSIPSEGTLAPTGDYYVSVYLMEERTTDFDGDDKEESGLMALGRASSDTAVVNYINTSQPAAPPM